MIRYLSFAFRLTSCSVIISRPIYGAAKSSISLFSMVNIPLCTWITSSCAFVCWGTFWLLPFLGYCEYGCSAAMPACVLSILVFWGDRPSSGPDGSNDSSIFTWKRRSFLFSLLALTPLHLTSSWKVHSSLKPLQHSFCRLFADCHSTGVCWNNFVD